MAFPESRNLSTRRFIQLFQETKDQQRFCFILGAGASVDSKIPAGNRLEMIWMDELMGERELSPGHQMNPDDTRTLGKQLYNEDEIEHSFDQIEKAWELARQKAKNDGSTPNTDTILGPTLSSEYYFDLYKLRFHPNPRNGYRYLEEKIQGATPSLGYHTLALILSEDSRHNLVITTNFDSLTEDALFLYTPSRPLVVGHESLAAFIDSDTNRPIIAKIHRGLMFDPFNSPETTDHLQDEWRKALDYAFKTYTPIVIGYGGGDSSLMAYLKECELSKGIYWCYMEKYGLPSKEVQKFVRKKNGCLVKIQGFDNLMRELGNEIYPNDFGPKHAKVYLINQANQRAAQYEERWKELENATDTKETSTPTNTEEQKVEKKQSSKGAETYSDYFNKAYDAAEKGDYDTAIQEYTHAIKKDSTRPIAYNNRGSSYSNLSQHEQAILDFNKAIELNPEYTLAYYNRGVSHKALGKYKQAIADYSKAIELDPNYVLAYNNRGTIYDDLGKYDLAIENYNKAIELDPKYVNAYHNRGIAYNRLSKYEQTIKDCSKAIELDPTYSSAYLTRGNSYHGLGQYEQAIVDYSKAIELDPTYVLAYHNRGNSHWLLGHLDQAIQDCTEAIKLDPNCADAYRKRSYAYRDLGKIALAEADEAKAKELEAAQKTP